MSSYSISVNTNSNGDFTYWNGYQWTWYPQINPNPNVNPNPLYPTYPGWGSSETPVTPNIDSELEFVQDPVTKRWSLKNVKEERDRRIRELLEELANTPLLKVPFWIEAHKKELEKLGVSIKPDVEDGDEDDKASS